MGHHRGCSSSKQRRRTLCFSSQLHSQLERAFQRAIIALELDKLKLTPHCGRHGAAATDMLMGSTSLRAVQRRGRWRAMSSVVRFEKHGKLLRQLNLMTEKQRTAAPPA